MALQIVTVPINPINQSGSQGSFSSEEPVACGGWLMSRLICWSVVLVAGSILTLSGCCRKENEPGASARMNSAPPAEKHAGMPVRVEALEFQLEAADVSGQLYLVVHVRNLGSGPLVLARMPHEYSGTFSYSGGHRGGGFGGGGYAISTSDHGSSWERYVPEDFVWLHSRESASVWISASDLPVAPSAEQGITAVTHVTLRYKSSNVVPANVSQFVGTVEWPYSPIRKVR
jgi:hypothetical protein